MAYFVWYVVVLPLTTLLFIRTQFRKKNDVRTSLGLLSIVDQPPSSKHHLPEFLRSTVSCIYLKEMVSTKYPLKWEKNFVVIGSAKAKRRPMM